MFLGTGRFPKLVRNLSHLGLLLYSDPADIRWQDGCLHRDEAASLHGGARRSRRFMLKRCSMQSSFFHFQAFHQLLAQEWT